MSEQLPQGFVKDVIGYCDPLSVLPGEQVHFKLSSYRAGSAQISLVRLISGDDRPHGTGLIEEVVDAGLPTEVTLGKQPLITGSYAVVPDMPALSAGEFECWAYPTLLRSAAQCVANLNGLKVCVSQDGVTATQHHCEAAIEHPLRERRWYHVKVRFGEGVALDVSGKPLGSAEAGWHATASGDGAHEQIPAGDWLFGAADRGVEHFNGRLEAPVVRNGERMVAAWDFSQAVRSSRIIDTGGRDYHGRLLQTPTRAVKGHAWDGSAQSFLQRPEHYGAIHFHEDDLTDAGWSDSVVFQVPTTLPSGQYALKVQLGESEDYVPFFVRAPRDRRRKLAYLVPTATYLAYANQRLGFTGGIFGEPNLRHANDAFLYAHEEVGYSLYEYHRDRSGVHFSSRLRPILNMKPRNGTWAFAADTHITAWLSAIDEPFDVVTDEDLHLEGVAALAGYRTIITGTHPEYYSSAMHGGLEQWLVAGGRLMYLGGNGFYWRIAHDPENPAIIEVRRAEDGTRAWIAEPGEYYHQFTGEYGGMWRRLGKPPNELVGIGFAAQGFDGGTHYRVQPGALDPRVAFIVDGVEGDEFWGAFGNQGGGAAGEEIDRWDERLGSPPHAVVLASSEGHKPGMLRVKEEFHMTEPLGNDPNVRADMVFFEVPGGGAVFSTGSISYAGSLAHNGYDNNIARLTGNVLRRFLDPESFPMP